jgi:thioesterase domain-containing protein
MPFAELIEPAGRGMYALASPPPVDGRFPHGTFEERAAAFAELIRDIQPTGPYDLVGWCYGGSNAYATAVELERDGVEVSVVVIDAHPPGVVDVEPDRAEIITAIAANLQWDYLPESTSIDDLRRMSPDEQIDYLLGIARAANYLPSDSGRAQIEAVVDMWIANLELLWRYKPTPLRGPLTMIRARDGDRAPFKAWEALAGGKFALLEAPGNHYTVVRPPHVRTVAAMLSGVRAETGRGKS